MKKIHLFFLNSTLFALGIWALPTAQAQICTREYAPVCGQSGDKKPQTFPNRCMLDNAQARFVALGECPESNTPASPPPKQPMTGHDSDKQGCKASAGYSWNAELGDCIRPWMSSAVTLEVAAYRQKCTSLPDKTCLMVRELQDGRKKPRWAPLSGDISGYAHPPGKRQLLRVRKDTQESFTADAPRTTYKLIRVLP